MSDLSILSFEYEECLIKYKEEMFKKHNIKEKYAMSLIRDDIFELLYQFCKVIFYPLEKLDKREQNHGFHITDIPYNDGNKRSFVFINTAQTIEKQVFTAAHELGHIWQVDEYVREHIKVPLWCNDFREKIISRFAAVMLMPKDDFIRITNELVVELGILDNRLDVMNALKLIVMLMNRFFAPQKSVIIRMVELDILSIDDANILLGNGNISLEKIEEIIQKFILDLGYVNFQYATNKKWIEGLSELLDIAETKECVPQSKIDYMRKMFGLKNNISIENDEELTINT